MDEESEEDWQECSVRRRAVSDLSCHSRHDPALRDLLRKLCTREVPTSASELPSIEYTCRLSVSELFDSTVPIAER